MSLNLVLSDCDYPGNLLVTPLQSNLALTLIHGDDCEFSLTLIQSLALAEFLKTARGAHLGRSNRETLIDNPKLQMSWLIGYRGVLTVELVGSLFIFTALHEENGEVSLRLTEEEAGRLSTHILAHARQYVHAPVLSL